MTEKKEAHKARDIFFKVGAGVAIFGVAFFVTFLSSSHFMPVSESSAETTGDYYANITNTGSIDISLVATPDGIGKVGKDTLTVDTNATSGYKLYLSTVSTAPNNMLYLSTDDTTGLTATTGSIATPSKLAPNTWGYAPSRSTPSDTAVSYTDAAADAVTGSAVFIGVPEYGDENIIYTNDTPTVSGSNTIDVYYGVNASTALPSGEYSNTVVYTAIVDAINPDSEDVTISPVSQNSLSAGTTVIISTGLYPGFAASDMGTISVALGGNACTNVTPSIGANGNLVVTCNTPAAAEAGSVDVVVTVAKYGKTYTLTGGYEYINPLPDFYTISTMQEMTSSVCNSVPTPSASATTSMTAENYDSTQLVAGGSYVAQTTLYDIRDNNSYIVRKLSDGSCWMTQDLKLGGSSAVTLTTENSDLPEGSANWTLNTENTGTWCTDQTAACYNQQLMLKTGVPNGYLYNWYAATAGTGVYGTGAGSEATASICPKGWKLPTGGPSSQFANLDIAYGGSGSNRTGDTSQVTKFLASPLNFNYTGYRNGGSVNFPSDYALYWSSTAGSEVYAYNLYFHSGGYFDPQAYNYKYVGFAVRCVAAS
ncbi:hypothetical protein IJH02_03450 [Candidatus Saccharibacteria bacterium]|nr:hypothetical protein [Candidatus Saccharibacteria bacterium]